MVQETARINFEATNLDVVEGRIKAIGGAINILGGAVETTVGLMGLLSVDEKVSKRFQEAATSAIAFADGAKRVFEGYKELREAADLFKKAQAASTVVTTANTAATAANNAVQTSSVGILGKARAAWNALTAAIARNPITLIAVALAAVIGGIIAYTSAIDDAAESVTNLDDKLTNLNSALERQKLLNEGAILDAKLKGQSEKQVLELQRKQTQNLLDITRKEAKLYSDRQLALSLKKSNKTATEQEIKDLETASKAYNDLTNQAIQYENQIKSINVQIKGIKAPKKGESVFDKLLKEEFQTILQQIEDTEKQIESLAEQSGKVYNKYLEEVVDDTRTRNSELFDLEQDFYALMQEGVEEKSKNAIFYEVLLRKQRLLVNLKYDALEKEQEDKKKKQEEDDAKDFKDRTEAEFNESIKLVEKYYTQQDTLLVNQGLDKEEYDKKIQQLELEKLMALKQLYLDYGKDISEIDNKIAKNTQGNVEKTTKLIEFFQSKKAEQIAGTLGALNSITSGMLEMAQQNSDDRLNAIEVDYNSRLQGLTGTDEEIAAQQQAIEEQKNRALEAERKKAFEDQKKFKIADTITSGLSSAFQAFGSAMQLGPILGPIVGGALSAMILTQMANTIQSIKNQQYVGSGATGGGGGGIGTPAQGPTMSNFGGNFSGAGPGGGGLAAGGSNPLGNNSTAMSAPNTNPNQPIRAYVVASDVSSGLDAQQSINNRRTF